MWPRNMKNRTKMAAKMAADTASSAASFLVMKPWVSSVLFERKLFLTAPGGWQDGCEEGSCEEEPNKDEVHGLPKRRYVVFDGHADASS